MNAQIFYLKSQVTTDRKIATLLRKHVFQGMTVDELEISDNYKAKSNEKEDERFRRFLRLFKASMHWVDDRVHDFDIVITDDSGKWGYAGGKALQHQDERYQLELFRASMGKVFPAVAIMDRMVMMPREVDDAFEKSRSVVWFLGGVVLADFQNSDSIDDSIRQVGNQLKTHIAKLCRSHMLARKIMMPDFEELWQLLRVAPEYLETLRGELTAPSAKLSCSIVSGAAKKGINSEVALEVSYDLEEPLGRVFLDVRAPCGVIEKPIKETFVFPGGKTEPRPIRFKVKPNTSPFCPLEAQFTVDDTLWIAAPFPIPLILDVQA